MSCRHAARVVGDVDAEEVAASRVPRRRDSRRPQRALHQRDLELEAQDHVERVGGLVGLDADQRGLTTLIARRNVGIPSSPSRGAKVSRSARQPVRPERL